ncbi:hypothetical protein Kpho01_21610 [Kitasatospora phosalacinea]|uniref:HTH cro/C1-type domain-containing protein n=1 Tax=Kitasatospora phosalacinea TaxID=2065 RepID=A0A9W6UP28_9ACTN|nr:hypothetical protein Kpho01_21610 [Kitasatospora phosalacinea]
MALLDGVAQVGPLVRVEEQHPVRVGGPGDRHPAGGARQHHPVQVLADRVPVQPEVALRVVLHRDHRATPRSGVRSGVRSGSAGAGSTSAHRLSQRSPFRCPKRSPAPSARSLDPSSSPLAAFGRQIRERRRRERLTQDGLGARAGYTGAYVSLIENGRRRPPVEFVRAIDRALGAAGALEGAWWILGRTAFHGGFPEYVGLEAAARRIQAWDIGLPPGTAQTEEFARALEAGYVERGAVTPDQAAERVGVLLGRQAPLHLPDPPELHLVLDESCIRTVVGSPEVAVRQLNWLAELSARPNIVL